MPESADSPPAAASRPKPARIRRRRAWVWAWTLPAAVAGWLVVGATFPSMIPDCGWAVVESGVVPERVWNNIRSSLAAGTVLALLWVVGYTLWARKRSRSWLVDAVLCLGFGASSWAIFGVGLSYTLGDFWDSDSLRGVSPITEEVCGAVVFGIAPSLIGGGFLAMFIWVVWALIAAADRFPPGPPAEV